MSNADNSSAASNERLDGVDLARIEAAVREILIAIGEDPTRDGLLKGGAEGMAIKPGDSKQSRLVRLIIHAEEPNMPEDGAKLPDSQIAAMACQLDHHGSG